ncbi:MAG: PLP-dependent transferase [Anaerolineales bacterium]
MKPKGFTTKVLNVPFNKSDPHGALQMPVYLSNAFEFASAEDLSAAFMGTKPAHVYSRATNPTIEYFEMRIKDMTGATAVTACASGMAAISNVIMTLLSAGDTILTTRHLFGHTVSLVESTFVPFGVQFRYADLTSLEDVESKIDSTVKLLFLETITNPQLEVADIQALARLASKYNIVFCVDTTLTPPYVFDARAHGVNLEVLSTTKFISGGGTSVGGLIIDHGTYDWSKNARIAPLVDNHAELAFQVKLRKEVYRNMGACLSPMNAFLQSIGLETLALRMDKAIENAHRLAAWLQEHPRVKTVNYPGLPSSPFYALARQQFGGKPGALLTFDLPSANECIAVLNRLKIIRRATNFNDNKSLAIHPFHTIYSEFPPEKRLEYGIREGMIRLSVGIEDFEDLQADLAQALSV